jgi:hypothetical protein
MNIESTNIKTTSTNQNQSKNSINQDSSAKFSDELKELESSKVSKESKEVKNTKEEFLENQNAESKELKTALNGLNEIVQELNQSDENKDKAFKDSQFKTDNIDMINKDYNIQENEILPQMNPNMNFSGDGQPFSSFMKEENPKQAKNNILGASAKELAEEASILSTMAENIAIANKNLAIKAEVEIFNENGIKKVDNNTGITTEIIVKYDAIIMNQADVEFFAELVEKGNIDLNQLTSQANEKTVQVSKTLINMLAKSIENNQPLRIDFDNNISVIIKISRDGKIVADFLPSSQVAEAYLKENLPLLRQRFEDNNIEYESLNQRERKENQKDRQQKERSQR